MAKDYGSRFCQGCGRLFGLTEPGQLCCASCGESGEPAPPPAPVLLRPAFAPPAPAKAARAAKPKAVTAPRRDRPKRPPAPRPVPRPPRPPRFPDGPVAGPRTLPMLRALADAPGGLTIPQLAEVAGGASSWINALGTTRQLMLKQQKQGRVEQAGTVEGDRTRPSILWRITEEGRRYVREAPDGKPCAEKGAGDAREGWER